MNTLFSVHKKNSVIVPHTNIMQRIFNCFTVHFNLLNLIYTKQCTFLYNNVLVYNVNIKTLKTLQHVSISIQIILRELVVSLLKSLS